MNRLNIRFYCIAINNITLIIFFRFVIVKHVRRDLIGELPLPQRLKDYLCSPHYYSEQVEQCMAAADSPQTLTRMSLHSSTTGRRSRLNHRNRSPHIIERGFGGNGYTTSSITRSPLSIESRSPNSITTETPRSSNSNNDRPSSLSSEARSPQTIERRTNRNLLDDFRPPAPLTIESDSNSTPVELLSSMQCHASPPRISSPPIVLSQERQNASSNTDFKPTLITSENNFSSVVLSPKTVKPCFVSSTVPGNLIQAVDDSTQRKDGDNLKLTSDDCDLYKHNNKQINITLNSKNLCGDNDDSDNNRSVQNTTISNTSTITTFVSNTSCTSNATLPLSVATSIISISSSETICTSSPNAITTNSISSLVNPVSTSFMEKTNSSSSHQFISQLDSTSSTTQKEIDYNNSINNRISNSVNSLETSLGTGDDSVPPIFTSTDITPLSVDCPFTPLNNTDKMSNPVVDLDTSLNTQNLPHENTLKTELLLEQETNVCCPPHHHIIIENETSFGSSHDSEDTSSSRPCSPPISLDLASIPPPLSPLISASPDGDIIALAPPLILNSSSSFSHHDHIIPIIPPPPPSLLISSSPPLSLSSSSTPVTSLSSNHQISVRSSSKDKEENSCFLCNTNDTDCHHNSSTHLKSAEFQNVHNISSHLVDTCNLVDITTSGLVDISTASSIVENCEIVDVIDGSTTSGKLDASGMVDMSTSLGLSDISTSEILDMSSPEMLDISSNSPVASAPAVSCPPLIGPPQTFVQDLGSF